MLVSKADTCLLLVDVQEKLFPAISDSQLLADNCQWLLSLANDLDMPILFSEQYPRGLGSTISSLSQILKNNIPLEKIHFSCAADSGCQQAIAATGKKQIIVIGIEAHVCVLQTVLGLIAQNYNVFVVADAVGSRNPYDRKIGLQRMQAHGAHIITKEMVFFECLQQAGTEQFKQLSQQYFPRSNK